MYFTNFTNWYDVSDMKMKEEDKCFIACFLLIFVLGMFVLIGTLATRVFKTFEILTKNDYPYKSDGFHGTGDEDGKRHY